MHSSRSNLSRKDSDRIYIDILRLERERQILKAKQEEEARELKQKKENEVGRTFLSKVMAKRKARLVAEGVSEEEVDKPLLPPTQVSPQMAQGTGNRKNLEIQIQIQPQMQHQHSHVIPIITDGMIPIPPEPIPTPTIVCPNGFKNLKFVNTFTLKFTPAECCGGPREVEIQSKDEDKCLCHGRINSETEVWLQKQNEEKEMDELLAYKYDLVTNEWSISFPELETVAYMVRPKPASRVSANQIYEIFSADGCSNYFNLGVEMEKSGSSRNPDFVFRVLNSNLSVVGTVILLSNFKAASVTIDESLWPSQKAVILAAGLYLCWDVVQEIRRREAWVRVLVASGILLTILGSLLMTFIYILRRED